ncbi:hypothetical protein K4F52_008939 [Lecanicillium sp. MT-2017a]|nr:hypothetical protein K4F52_008939 [Lecanicillium sp. MT-2017a]
MTLQDQPPLAAKVAYFTQAKALSDTESDDSLAASEDGRRLDHRRFFEARPRGEGKERAVAGVQVATVAPAEPASTLVATTPKPKETTGGQRTIKATQSGAKKMRNRVTELLGDEGDVVGETPLAPAKRAQETQTPLAVFASKRKTSRAQTDSPSVSSATATAAAAAAAKKRKRNSEPALRPEAEQIFKGLTFYYVPDNDIAPARRLRIAKAREFGATWTRDVGAATHVVVDRDIGYADVQTLLRKKGVDEGRLLVVGEEYPVDCIQFRAVLDARQKRYLISGQTVEVKGGENDNDGENEDKNESENQDENKNEEVVQEAVSRHERSVASLKLKEPPKNPAKWDYVPPKGTPDRSAPPSAQGGTPVATPADVESQLISLGLEVVDDGAADGEGSAVAANDELSSYISMMQEFKNLPLDNDDEDETASVATIEGENLGSDEDDAQKQKSQRKELAFAERFACNRAGTKESHDDNPNERTIAILQRMHAYYERVSDQWRTIAYRKAMATLKRQPTKVTTEEEAVRLPGIGRRLAQKIEEIVMTDGLRRLEYAEQDDTDEVLKLFLGIYGVGPRLARQWAAQGHRTLEDLRAKVKLTSSQIIGIERYKDLNRKIPRDEVRELGEVVKKVAKGVDEEVELIVGGSYRRGANQSNDIDFIVTKPGTTSSAELRPFLDELVQLLEEQGVLVARLASSRGGSIWYGCCVLPQDGDDVGKVDTVWRRIDFLLVPESEMGGALIYFTGDDIFNRSMRLLASKKGLRLNQRGLYKRPIDGMKAVGEELVEGASERRIFEILGVEWREPWERWC